MTPNTESPTKPAAEALIEPVMARTHRRGVSSLLSLRWKLQLLIAALVLCVVATLLAVSYREVQRAQMGVAAVRAQGAADQIAGLLAQSAQQRLLDGQRFVNGSSVLTDCLRSRSPDDCEAARARLQGLPTPTEQVVELWTAGGDRVLVVATPPEAERLMPAGKPPKSGGAGPLRVSGDILFAETVWPVPADRHKDDATDRQAAGFVAIRRPVSAAPTRDLLNRLLGDEASISIGNASGDVWTNLASAVAPPPVDLTKPGVKSYRDASGGQHLGALSSIKGTPWAMWVEFPESAFVGRAHAFLARMSLVALAFVAIACGGAAVISRHITAPIRQLTDVSEAIARGDYSRRVTTGRRDEIGGLGEAFNAMAAGVQSAYQDLEKTVDERTARLEAARVELEQRVAELKEAREEQERFFAMSPDLLCIAGADGRLRKVNDAWEHALGWTAGELTAVPYEEFVHPDDLQTTAAETARQSARHRTNNFENRYRRKDGSYVWLSWTATAFPDRGVVYAAARDITERRRVAREMQDQVEELAHVNQELESFSYSVSHDLRAPLRHVTGFAALLQQSSAEALGEEGRRLLAKIVSAATRMGVLIDDLLAFSRLGRTPLVKSRVDVNQLVHEARQEVTLGLNGRAVSWRCETLPTVDADPSLLRLALVNLLSNALKYTATRSHAEIAIGSVPAQSETILFVRDNGVGFDPDYAHKLFGVFQRLHTAQEFEGTGIGLANVRRIVQRHGGRTWAEGIPDGGATFYVALPLEAS